MTEALATMQTIGNQVVEHSNPAAVAAAEAAKARIQAAYIMAMQRPRDTDASRLRILKACKRPAFADRAEYSKPVGGRKITGPSIRFAETALQLWGNLSTEVSIVYEDSEVRRVQIICTDLETNVYFQKQISVGKTVERHSTKGREIVGKRVNSSGETVYIVAATDDEIATKEAAMISKVIRNEGLRLIPGDIVDDALAECRKTLSNRDAQDPDATKKAILDTFAGFGVMPAEIEEHLGHSMDQVSQADIVELRRIATAMRDGESRWSDFSDKAAKTKGQQVKTEAPFTAQQAKPEPKPETKPAPVTIKVADVVKALGNPPIELLSGWLYDKKQIKASLEEMTEACRLHLTKNAEKATAEMKAWGAENGY